MLFFAEITVPMAFWRFSLNWTDVYVPVFFALILFNLYIPWFLLFSSPSLSNGSWDVPLLFFKMYPGLLITKTMRVTWKDRFPWLLLIFLLFPKHDHWRCFESFDFLFLSVSSFSIFAAISRVSVSQFPQFVSLISRSSAHLSVLFPFYCAYISVASIRMAYTFIQSSPFSPSARGTLPILFLFLFLFVFSSRNVISKRDTRAMLHNKTPLSLSLPERIWANDQPHSHILTYAHFHGGEINTYFVRSGLNKRRHHF